jgi:dihydrofolate reductase
MSLAIAASDYFLSPTNPLPLLNRHSARMPQKQEANSETGMRKITVSTMVSLDGVTGDPESWAMENFDESARVDGLKRLLISDGMLLGRVTYEALSKAWSGRTGAFADRINEIPKFVFSSTLDRAEWGNAEIVRGDAISEAKRIKSEGDRDLVIFGHGRLTKTLLKGGLVDELRLLVNPVLVGQGTLAFTELEKRKLTFTSSLVLPSGVVILVYGVPER